MKKAFELFPGDVLVFGKFMYLILAKQQLNELDEFDEIVYKFILLSDGRILPTHYFKENCLLGSMT